MSEKIIVPQTTGEVRELKHQNEVENQIEVDGAVLKFAANETEHLDFTTCQDTRTHKLASCVVV